MGPIRGQIHPRSRDRRAGVAAWARSDSGSIYLRLVRTLPEVGLDEFASDAVALAQLVVFVER